MNIICVIDDKVTLTAPVVRGLVLYENKYRKDKEEVFYRVLFAQSVVLDNKQKQDIKELQKKIENENRGQKNKNKVKCFDLNIAKYYNEYLADPEKLIRLVKEKAKIQEGDNVVYLLDLELSQKNDMEHLNANQECLSMRLYRSFIEKEDNCKLFSTYRAEGFVKSWEDIYKETSVEGERQPEIMSRGFLSFKYFDTRNGVEIFGGFDN